MKLDEHNSYTNIYYPSNYQPFTITGIGVITKFGTTRVLMPLLTLFGYTTIVLYFNRSCDKP